MLTLAAQSPTTAAGEASSAASPMFVARGTAIVDQWRPGQHLYVKGDLGLGRPQLSQLERWLAEHASNWTVALIESAADERFTDAAGESFAGLDAVEHALGKGLPNRTAFGELIDPRTRERNGAFLLIFLKERKFSYFASEAHDRRGLGEDRWLGQLDQPAIGAMRDGGRIVDAVKDTITQIETRLTLTLQGEEANRERQATAARLARERETEQARSGLASASQAVDLLETKASELQSSRPGLTGELGRPDIGALRADLVAAQATLRADQPSAARALADSVRQRAIAEASGIDDYRQAGEEFEAVGRELDRVANLAYAQAVRAEIETARATLNEARLAHDRGDRGYAGLLSAAREQVVAAERAARKAEAMARRQSQVRIAGFSGVTLVLIALGAALHRRRRPFRREALDLLEAWSSALGEKSVALAELVDQAQTVLGLSSEDVAVRFAGRTLKLGRQAVRDVDEACIMAVCAQRIHRAAEAWARPTKLPSRTRNFFGAGRYRTAIRQLRDEPIVFRPEEGLELALRGPKTTRDRLLGPLESYQPFRMSFNELMEAFSQRSERALASLEQITGSLHRLGGDLQSLEQRILSLKVEETYLTSAELPSDAFRLRALFRELLPSIESDRAEAEQTGVRDPVGALEAPVEAAQRKLADAEALVRVARTFHRDVHPALSEAVAKLAEAAMVSDWIEVTVAELSDRAEDLACQGGDTSMAGSITQLADELQHLAGRAAQAVALDQTRREVTRPALDTAGQTITATRGELANRLRLDPKDLLREPGCDPSERLALAEEQTAAAKAALQRGDVEAARRSLDAAAALGAEATRLTDATRAAAEAHAERLANCQSETERLEGAIPTHEAMLSAMAAAYPPSSLLLGQGDPTHPNANGTVADNLREVSDHLTQARELAARAAQVFRQGRVLEAEALLIQAAANHNQTRFRLTEIAEKRERIRQTEVANDQRARQLAGRIEELAPVMADARTTTQTLGLFEAAQQRLSEATAPSSIPARDPFHLALELAALESDCSQAAEAAARDWAHHAAVERGLQAGAAELAVASRLVQRAAADNVTDSAAIREATRELQTLSATHDRLRDRLTEPHGHWLALDAEANQITHTAARLASLLTHELEAAQAALASLTAAATQVHAASGWRGWLGVSILGSPGSDQLNQARALLSQGAYQAARQTADAARQTATLAIAQAEAEQRRRQRAEQERQDRERRQREEAEQRRRQAARSSGFGSSPFSSSGSRRSSFSSGSGSARASFGHGSGTSRSGW